MKGSAVRVRASASRNFPAIARLTRGFQLLQTAARAGRGQQTGQHEPLETRPANAPRITQTSKNSRGPEGHPTAVRQNSGFRLQFTQHGVARSPSGVPNGAFSLRKNARPGCLNAHLARPVYPPRPISLGNRAPEAPDLTRGYPDSSGSPTARNRSRAAHSAGAPHRGNHDRVSIPNRRGIRNLMDGLGARHEDA